MEQHTFNLIQQTVCKSNLKKKSKVENAMAVAGFKAALLAGEKYQVKSNSKQNSSYFRPAITREGRQ